MALDGNRLGDAIAAAVQALYTEPVSPADAAKLQSFWRTVGNQIVLEIDDHAVVNTSDTTAGADPQGGTVASTGTGVGTVT